MPIDISPVLGQVTVMNDLTELLAYSAGLEGSPSGTVVAFLESHSQPRRWDVYIAVMLTIRCENDPGKKYVLADFCAKYLPRLFTNCVAILSGPIPHDGDLGLQGIVPLSILCDVAESPYFLKYLRSLTSPELLCEWMATRITKRVLIAEHVWEERLFRTRGRCLPACFGYLEDLPKILTLLLTLCIVIGSVRTQGDLLPPPIQAQLYHRVKLWIGSMEDGPGRLLKNLPLKIEATLSERVRQRGCVSRMKAQLSGENQCALPGCDIRNNLAVCDVCGTASYCSMDHERMHREQSESPHRFFCFNTVGF